MGEPGDRPWPELGTELARWAGQDVDRRQVMATVLAVAAGMAEIAGLLARGALAGSMGAATGKRGLTDEQKALDLVANAIIARALEATPTQSLISEEMDEPHMLDPDGSLIVALDPIDGSSNIESNAAIGTIVSILPAGPQFRSHGGRLPSGRHQRAAGFALYGPATLLVLTVGEGTQIYTLDPDSRHFRLTSARAQIPAAAPEFAINLSNYRHWSDAMRLYVEDCLRGREGPRGVDFNMRWTASPVAEFMRILTRGGVFLYPGDARPGYGAGRLRLVYEANPLAMIVEQAGGRASNGRRPILDLEPGSLHEHVPTFMGSREEVELITRLIAEPPGPGERSPLFSRRGLLRI